MKTVNLVPNNRFNNANIFTSSNFPELDVLEYNNDLVFPFEHSSD